MQRVLAADPSNQRALAGLGAIATYFRDSAAKLCAREQWINCGLFARRGLEAVPDDAELLKLKETAEAAQRGL